MTKTKAEPSIFEKYRALKLLKKKVKQIGLKKILLKSLEEVLITGILISSYFFIISAWNSYTSKQSSFSHEERAIDQHPAITICFDEQSGKVWNRSMFDLGSEITFSYFDKDLNLLLPLKENENFFPNIPNEVIGLRKAQSCYKITSRFINPQNVKKGTARAIRMDFSSNASMNELPSKIVLYATSEPNSYGAESKRFLEGEAFQQIVKDFGVRQGIFNDGKPRHYVQLSLKPKMKILLKEKSGCQDEEFWPQFESEFVTEAAKKCPNACMPRELPGRLLGKCPNYVDWKCSDIVFEKKIRNASFVPCGILEYIGKLEADARLSDMYMMLNEVFHFKKLYIHSLKGPLLVAKIITNSYFYTFRVCLKLSQKIGKKIL